MYKVVTPGEMKEIDRYMIETLKIPGIVLMENAAAGVVNVVRSGFPGNANVLAVCGAGNNGGDGFAAARQLLAIGYPAEVLLIGRAAALLGDARLNAAFFEKTGRLRVIKDAPALKTFLKTVRQPDVIIDALFGTGLCRAVTGVYADMVAWMNENNAFRISVDIPSGIDGGSGAVLGAAVKADATVTFQYPKPGHFIYPGREHAGSLSVVKIGVDTDCPALEASKVYAYPANTRSIRMPKRKKCTHKGDYGKLAILTGSTGLVGAGVMAQAAALKTGAGLVTVGIPECLKEIYQKKLTEAMTYPLPCERGALSKNAADELGAFLEGKNTVAAGPGLSTAAGVKETVARLVIDLDMKKVLDADALNVLSEQVDILKGGKGDIVLTPHPAEFSRLSKAPVEEILRNPMQHAFAFAKRYGVVVVLKGATTVVAAKDGRAGMILAGSPGMAKGGSGDVLTGIIGALLAQGISPYDAAVTGCHINGLAGAKAAKVCGEYAMTPLDTIAQIGAVIESLVR